MDFETVFHKIVILQFDFPQIFEVLYFLYITYVFISLYPYLLHIYICLRRYNIATNMYAWV